MSIRLALGPSRRVRRVVTVITAFSITVTLLLSACGGGATSSGMPQQSSSAVSNVSKLPPSGKARVFKTVHTSGGKTANAIAITATSTRGTSAVQLRLPADADAKSLAVTLNGKDISGRFSTAACAEGECAKAMLSASDGYAAKNVLSASVRGSSSGMASGRVRFAQAGTAVTAAATVCDPIAMCPPWLPPSVPFNTLTPGGWTPGGNSWIQVNGQNYPVTTPASCSGAHYAVVVLDRQTLVEKTAAPESSPQCFLAASDLKSYLATLTRNDLVIAGTVFEQSAADDLDTTPIGGSSFANATHIPQGYMVIGAGGQQAGTAYENYYDSYAGDPQFNPFATGSLQEDANGNYNFQSSDAVEYAVSPNDPGTFTNISGSAIALNIPTGLQIQGESRRGYSPTLPSFNGLWLLIVDRVTLQPVAGQGCDSYSNPSPGVIWSYCGTKYPVAGDTPAATRDANWTSLAAALTNVNGYEIAFLVSSGAVGTNTLPITFQSGQNYTGFAKFAAALQNLGGNAALIAGPTFGTTDSYSLVGFGGASNPLVGGSAEASSMLQPQGQSGVLHGTLQRNRNGLFQPGQTSQEPQPVFAAKGGLDDSDFAMLLASYQQPVDWPSSSASTLLPGASTIDGQLAAYRFISHWLLAGYYVKGISGPHQDDLHFFFSGSSNTWLDYHTVDPATLAFPTGTSGWSNFECDTVAGSTCTFTAPGDSASSAFTAADFSAVQKQVSLEVLYLTNALQFLVTGSTNMKDVIAAGNANVGLALTGAASTILGSDFVNKQQVPSTTPISFSWQSLLGLLGGIASTVANAEGLGELTSVWSTLSASTQKGIKQAVGTANTIGALLGTIGSGGSLKSSTQTSQQLSEPFTQFTTTLGELATSELQSQLIVGFDVLADNITSDWARLRSIGPRVVDVNDPVFYAPNQVAQNTALQALTNASAQTFYFSLLPAFYHVDFWSTVEYYAPSDPTEFQPAMGSLQGSASPICAAFYLQPNQSTDNPGHLSAYQGIVYPTPGSPQPLFPQDSTGALNDVLVIAGTSVNKKTSNTFIPSIDPDLATTLFAPDQLNISLPQFVAANGPMPRIDAATNNPSGWSYKSICNMWDYDPDGAQAPTSSPGEDVNGDIVTTTTLTSATRDTLGQSTVLTAVVDAGGQPLDVGSVYFSVDGQIVGKANVGADGTAMLTIPQIALGNHTVEADYSSPDGYAVSSSTPTTLGVYAGVPDLAVTAASASLDVSYDKPSAPLPVTIASVAGLSGDVQLSCSGLPVGMSCTFDTPTPMLAADGSVQTSVVIGPTVATQAALGLLLLPMLIIGWRREDGSVRRRAVPAILAFCMAAATLAGCSGDSSSIAHETGTKTVLINATAGGVSRSVAIDVHID